MTQDDMFEESPYGLKPRRVHENSRKAYHEELPIFSARELAIMDVFRESGGFSMTDRTVMQRMGFTDKNSVSPRITALINEHKVLVETGKVKCPVTGKTVRVVGIAQ